MKMWRGRLWRRLRARVRILSSCVICSENWFEGYCIHYDVLIPNAIGVSESQLYNKQNNPYVQANTISTTKVKFPP